MKCMMPYFFLAMNQVWERFMKTVWNDNIMATTLLKLRQSSHIHGIWVFLKRLGCLTVGWLVMLVALHLQFCGSYSLFFSCIINHLSPNFHGLRDHLTLVMFASSDLFSVAEEPLLRNPFFVNITCYGPFQTWVFRKVRMSHHSCFQQALRMLSPRV